MFLLFMLLKNAMAIRFSWTEIDVFKVVYFVKVLEYNEYSC